MSDESRGADLENNSPPRIIRLGKIADLHHREKPTRSDQENPFLGSEINLNILDSELVPNQKAKISVNDDGSLDLEALQDSSTPGLKTGSPILLTRGNYTLSVEGASESESTFFPWAMTLDGTRVTPTVYISTRMSTTSVQFYIPSDQEIYLGVLCHRQKIGDMCHIDSIRLEKIIKFFKSPDKGSFRTIKIRDLTPHHSTEIRDSKGAVIVTSKPISTPGTYAIIDVIPNSTISIYARVEVKFPSVAFLYAADSITGNEIIRRNIIFESARNSEDKGPTELWTSIRIPEGVIKIRLGLLFSTITKPENHSMKIHDLEVVKYKNMGDVVDESYVINMEKDHEKLAHCKSQASRFDFEITPWRGTDGSTEPHISDWTEYMEKPWNDIDEKLNRKAIDRPGAWGYLLSMRGIFLDAINKKHNSIAIFDDDYILASSFDHRFSKFIELIGNEWDVAYLGASQWRWGSLKQPDGDFYEPDDNTNGTFAVIYREPVFREILDQIDLMEAPFDAGPLRKVVLGTSKGRAFVSLPNIVIANLEKQGIRESRNQIDFSKRFGWELKDFPSWFNSWSQYPVILRDSGSSRESQGELFVTGVTTMNRKEYLMKFVESWAETKTHNFETMLIIADDGSDDGTIEWLLDELDIGTSRLVVIRNNSTGIARQSNSIFDFISEMDESIASVFMCNDDIRFLKPGWDEAYYRAMRSSGYGHLVYFNPEWKPATHQKDCPESEFLISHCKPREAMGCFYTLTPKIIDELGYFDESAFPVRGHSHVDYTMRACRILANGDSDLYDLRDSNEFIGMVLKDEYKRTNKILSVKEMMLTTSDIELQKRESILQTDDRVFVARGW